MNNEKHVVNKSRLVLKKRIRPKIMTMRVILAGLIPIIFIHGTGVDIMKRIAALTNKP